MYVTHRIFMPVDNIIVFFTLYSLTKNCNFIGKFWYELMHPVDSLVGGSFLGHHVLHAPVHAFVTAIFFSFLLTCGIWRVSSVRLLIIMMMMMMIIVIINIIIIIIIKRQFVRRSNMAWVQLVHLEEASGHVAKLFSRSVSSALSVIDIIIKILVLSSL